MAKQALGPEARAARREVIITAARDLFLASQGELPSAAEVASSSGLAKGTVYLYFRTKEEIFAALLGAEWARLLDHVEGAFGPSRRDPTALIGGFIEGYVDYVDGRPVLMRLDALGYGVLDRNLDLTQLRAMKLSFAERLSAVGGLVDDRLALPPGRGIQLLTRTYALTRGLWQSLDHSEALADLMSDPALAHIKPPFATELREALAEYWRGAVTVAVPAGSAPGPLPIETT